MDIKEAVEKIYQSNKFKERSLEDVIGEMRSRLANSSGLLRDNDFENARKEIEYTLHGLLYILKVLEINPEESINSQLMSMIETEERTMHIYTDKVEIRVGNEIKGSWAIWSTEDLADALKIAQEFNCKVIKEEDIFAAITENSFLEINNV